MAAHVLEELEVEDGTNTVVIKVTLATLARAKAVITGLGAAPGHALECFFSGLWIDYTDSRVLIIHDLHHLSVAKEVTGIGLTILLQAFYNELIKSEILKNQKFE